MLRDVTRADLVDPVRLERLWERAVADGIVPGSDARHVDFFAAAAQAIEKGDDAVRLFCHLINEGRWETITNANEETGRRMLLAYRQRNYDRPDNRTEPVHIGNVVSAWT